MPRANANSRRGKTAKKTAAKKTAKKTAKKVAKKKIAAKKTVKKKVVSTKAKKATRKTTTAKKVPIKNRVAKKVKPTKRAGAEDHKNVAIEQLFKKPEPVAQQKDDSKVSIKLPSVISVEAIEKSRFIRSLVSPRGVKYGRFAALSLAFLFVSFGSFYSATLAGLLGVGANSASVINAVTESSATLPEPALPEFTVLSAPPSTLDGTHRVSFLAVNTQVEAVYLENLQSGDEINIDYQNAAAQEYVITINSQDLAPGTYRIRVEAQATQLNREDVFTVGRFTVASNEDIRGNTVSAQTPLEEDEMEDEEDEENTLPEPNEEDDDVIVEDRVANIVETASMEDSFNFALSSTTITRSTVVQTTVPTDIEKLEIYLTPVNSPTKRFLTSGEFLLNSWRFYIDVENVPNGRYTLHAIGYRGDVPIEGRPISISIMKPLPERPSAVRVAEESETDETEEGSTQPSEQDNQPQPQREFTELSLTPTEADQGEASQIVTELMRDRKTSLETLLRNYSAAVQGGNSIAISVARESLRDEREQILRESGSATGNVERELTERFLSLEEKIDTFETLRRESEGGRLAADSDGDGISDIDEELLFRTNPNAADSDDDGIPDAVEVLRGFNPNSSVEEAVIVHESPRTTLGLERPDVLLVENVSPQIVSTEDSNNRVFTSVSGRALPNSYVTLYIFSTPTIVTVRTDETGQFEYVFEKELADGEHEVYVAVTDNTGSIVAQSEPFRFVKEAEAFTLGQASEPQPLPTVPDTSSFGIVASMGVLALGVILLMLGLGLRPEQISETEAAA